MGPGPPPADRSPAARPPPSPSPSTTAQAPGGFVADVVADAPLNFRHAASKDSTAATATADDAWIRRLTAAASAPCKTKPDSELWPLYPAEAEALATWTMGGLVLDVPPAFLVATHTRAERIVYLHYFEAYLEGTLVAMVPPAIRFPAHIAETTLLAALVAATTPGTPEHERVT